MANYIKGNAIENATSYTLHKAKTNNQGELDSNPVATQSSGGAISFDLDSDLIKSNLGYGTMYFAVKAHNLEYLSSEYSNIVGPYVIDAPPEPEGILCNCDFTAHDIQYYIDRNVLKIPGDTSIKEAVCDSEGLYITADTALSSGLELVNKASIKDDLVMEFTARVRPVNQVSGITQANYMSFCIISNDPNESFTNESNCLSPCVFAKSLGKTDSDGLYVRPIVNLATEAAVAGSDSTFLLPDGAFHTYKIESSNSGKQWKAYRDGTPVGETTVTGTAPNGTFGTILGIREAYPYKNQFKLHPGYTIKQFRVYLASAASYFA